MLHAAIMGSIERFSSVMIEHFGGAFPTWLAPEQVRIIPITSENIPYAQKLAEQLKAEKVRVTVDLDNERMQKKIFAAQQMKVPFMVILGQKEQETDTLSFRTRSGGETNNISVDKFITGILSNISQKSLDFEI